jgi:lipopolysaccharide/colanic/teichoic acid biosynthesis glycosyltransferase
VGSRFRRPQGDRGIPIYNTWARMVVSEATYSQHERVAGMPLILWRRLRRPLFLCGLYGADLAAPTVAFIVAYSLRFGAVPFATPLAETLAQPGTQFVLLFVTLVHMLMLRQAGIYRLHRTWIPLDFFMSVGFVCTVSALLFSVVGRGQDDAFGSRILLLYLWLLLNTMTFAAKLGARIVVLLMLCFGIGVKKVVLVGNTETAHRLMRTLRQHPQLGYRVIGVLFRGGGDASFEGATSHGRPASQARRALLDFNPDLVMIATSARKDEDMLDLIAGCTASGIEVRLVPEFFEVYSSKLEVDRVGVVPMVHLRALKVPLAGALFKRAADVVLALPVLPVLGLAALLLQPRARRLGEPVIVKRPRVGRDGAPFGLWAFNPKLWSAASESSQVPSWAIALPQILNVLRGEMSLVGPRPGRPDRAVHYNLWEKRTQAVRPGIIGFREVNEATEGEAAADQMSWDITYLDRRSAAFDLNLVLTSLVRLAFQGRSSAGKAG